MKKIKFNSFAYDAIATIKPDLIDGRCQAKFRKSTRYEEDLAPFGFDWVRTGDYITHGSPDTPYKGNMGRYYLDSKKTKLSPKTSDDCHLDISSRMYDSLCRSFLPGNLLIFPTKGRKMRRYHVPVLSIYPYSAKHPIIAQLSLEIEIESNISTIQLEFNNSLFEITGGNSLSTEKGKHVYEISIKCIKEFSQDEYIHVIATNPKGKRKKAGMLRICKNAKPYRYQTKILLVNTKFFDSMDDTALPITGDAEDMEVGKEYIKDMLQHALISCEFEEMELDLGHDSTMIDSLQKFNGANRLLESIFKQDSVGKSTPDPKYTPRFRYLEEKLKAIKDIENYSAIIYFLGVGLSISTNYNITHAEGLAIPKYAMLAKECKSHTNGHELLHAWGLGHSFDNYALNGEFHPFTFRKYTTDNIMDYSKDYATSFNERTGLWEWQWIEIREVCIKEE